MANRLFSIVCIFVFLAGVFFYQQNKTAIKSNFPLRQPAEVNLETTISNNSKNILSAIKKRDYVALSKYVHPAKGLRFSPYAYVNIDTDLVFLQEKIDNFSIDTSKYTWGSYDGSGEPITLTVSEYINKFVYDQDYLAAKETSYNKIIKSGNTANNISTAYPASLFMEYHFPGFEDKYEGMDWKSLRLVFEKYTNDWYLSGIIHDQWTI